MSGWPALPVVFTAAQVQAAVARLGAQVAADYAGRDPLVLGVQTGAFVFLADLVRCVPARLQVDFVQVGSYGAARASSGEVRLLHEPRTPLAGRHVLLVEDIVDSGNTVRFLLEYCQKGGAASVALCSLLVKGDPRGFGFPIDYWGLQAPPAFLVGYGLDDAGRWRNLPDIRRLD